MTLMRRLTRFLPTLLILVAIAFVAVPTASATADSDTMAYCTAQDVIDAYDSQRIGELGGNPDGNIDRKKVEAAVQSFGEHLEIHVRMQHPDNPFDTTHEYLNALNVEGAWLTMQKRSPGGMDDQAIQQEKRLDTKLMHIASGKIDLKTQAEKDDAPDQALKADDLIQTRDSEFGLHRRLDDLNDTLC